MPAEPLAKITFGGCDVDHFGPPANANWPKAINVVVSFEDALKLHLSLGQALAKLNSYNRSTKGGRRSAVNLCVYTQTHRITMNEGKIRQSRGRQELSPRVSEP